MPFLCLLSLKEKVQAEGYHAACVQYVTVCISHIIVAQIVAEKEVSQRCALLKRSCQTPCLIYAEIEVSQRCALRQHSFKTLCPAISNVIGTEIEVHQRSALRLHSYKTLRSHRQSWDANARSSRVFIWKEPLNAVHLSELSDQLDVTHESSKRVKLALTDDPKRYNQIKIMPFIQTCLAQSQSASSKAITLYMYNMSLFLVACLLNRWERASSASSSLIAP